MFVISVQQASFSFSYILKIATVALCQVDVIFSVAKDFQRIGRCSVQVLAEMLRQEAKFKPSSLHNSNNLTTGET